MKGRGPQFFKREAWLLFLLAMILVVSPAWADTQKIIAAVDAASDNCKVVAQKIFEWKELGQQEFKSSQLLMEELKKLGYKVTGDLKVPEDLVKGGIAKTAFRAEMAGKGPGPTVTIMLEYDALPNGHSCGHNLIAASGLLAAAALAKVMPETPGRVLVIGTPDEERGSLGGGKVCLLEGGHFEGTDVVLITHPGDDWSLDQRMLAVKRAMFHFKGKAAHAAAAPHKGISALDAVILTFIATDMLREHVRQDVRIHGVIHKGGTAANIVPELAQAEFMVRALDTTTMETVYEKVVNCARAGALATGATLEFKPPRVALPAPIIVPEYINLVRKNILAVGVPESELKTREDFGSSDLAAVGHRYPTVNVRFKIAPEGTPGHSDAFRDAAGSEAAWKPTVLAGKVVALTAYELLTNPEKVKAIKAQFADIKAKEGK
jgi:amidohydrolase